MPGQAGVGKAGEGKAGVGKAGIRGDRPLKFPPAMSLSPSDTALPGNSDMRHNL